jgi:hypothetical protein
MEKICEFGRRVCNTSFLQHEPFWNTNDMSFLQIQLYGTDRLQIKIRQTALSVDP